MKGEEVVENTFNFEVSKVNKNGVVQSRIIQLDYGNRILKNLKKGKIQKSFHFSEIKSYKVEESGSVLIFFKDDKTYEVTTQSEAMRADLCEKLDSIITHENLYDDYINQRKSRGEAIVLKQTIGHKKGKIKWARRRLVLTSTLLLVFRASDKDDDNSYPLNVVPLVDIWIFQKGTNILELRTKKRSFELKFENEKERDAWYLQLNGLIKHTGNPEWTPSSFNYETADDDSDGEYFDAEPGTKPRSSSENPLKDRASSLREVAIHSHHQRSSTERLGTEHMARTSSARITPRASEQDSLSKLRGAGTMHSNESSASSTPRSSAGFKSLSDDEAIGIVQNVADQHNHPLLFCVDFKHLHIVFRRQSSGDSQ
eukprot:Colp12_sorted_trinity150504_noHs@22751